jgi:hypothetical protein
MSESIYSHLLLSERLSWGYHWAQQKIRSKDVTSRSKFLNSLALLLNGNATCTAVYISEADKTVYIARNDPITASDQRYFDRFFHHIQIYAHLCFDHDKKTVIKKIKHELDSLVFEYNSKKIIRRFTGRHRKVIDGLTKILQWNTDEKCVFIKELQSNQESNQESYRNQPLMTDEWCLISKKYTEEEYIEYLLKQLDRFLVARDALIRKNADPTDDQLILAVRLANALYQSRLFRCMLDYSAATALNGVYYFEKTSGHERSLGLLLKCLLKQENDYADIYKNIFWKLVRPIEQEQELNVTPRQAFEKIFTKLSHSSNEDLSHSSNEDLSHSSNEDLSHSSNEDLSHSSNEDHSHSSNEDLSNIPQRITIDTFYDKHLEKLKTIDKNRIYVGNMHAEILLIDYLLKNNINKKEVRIGISKMPCLLCSVYIGALNKKHDCYFYQDDSTHGKIYAKWLYRHEEDPAIIDLINNMLIEKIQNSIQKLCRKNNRRGPNNSGDSDIMHISLKEKAFDEEQLLEVDP